MVGSFCWCDLAASDAWQARSFYGRVFGWTCRDQHDRGGGFTRLDSGGRSIGSLYQLSRRQLELGVPSHWTPYVRVQRMEEAVDRVLAEGGTFLVRPIVAPEARIALVQDPVGALIGLWERAAP
jgi:predicted enzyme related to lactoylglutathione lyase